MDRNGVLLDRWVGLDIFSSEDWSMCSGCAKNSMVERRFANEATIVAVTAANRVKAC